MGQAYVSMKISEYPLPSSGLHGNPKHVSKIIDCHDISFLWLYVITKEFGKVFSRFIVTLVLHALWGKQK